MKHRKGLVLNADYTCIGLAGWENIATAIFKDQVDAQAAYFSESAPLWPVNTVICINCIPQPVPALDRMCPGYYLSWLKPETWEDPTYPGDITKFREDGNCIHNKPWFRVKESE